VRRRASSPNLRRGGRALLVLLGVGAAAAVLAWAVPRPAVRPGQTLISAGLSARTGGGLTRPGVGFNISGAFYQPDLAEGFDDPIRRRRDFARLAAWGGTSLWLQYLAHGDHSLLEPWPERRDPVRELLDDAHAAGLRVWVGTREDPRLWEEPVSVPLWKEVGDRALAIAEEAAARYGDHPGFAGWYWTPEIVWAQDPSPGRAARLARVTARHVAALRTLLPGTPVAIAVGPGGTLGHEIPAGGWCRVVAEARPDALVVMDGVGTGHVDVIQLDMVYAVTAGCAERVGARLVADIEVFGGGREPDPSRLRAQARAARRADAVVAFDLPHHLKEGSVGAAVLDGGWPEGAVVPSAEERNPADWRGLDLATIDLRPERGFESVRVVTREPHPDAVSLSLGLPDAELVPQGALTPREGPGRDELTWRWTGEGVWDRARITLRRGDGDLSVSSAALLGPVSSP